MIDFKVLEAFNTSDDCIKRVMCAVAIDDTKPPKESKEEKQERLDRKQQNERDIKFRKKLEEEIQSRLYDGVASNLKTWRPYAAADVARDTSIITKTKLSLAKFAMGNINVEQCVNLLSDSDCTDGQQYIKRNAEKKAIGVDVPRFVEMSVNLVRSIILRRSAAQNNLFMDGWPYYYYEPRSTGLVAKLRADVLSQRVDIMADQFDYRHHDSQWVLDAFYYGHSIDFIRRRWEVEKQWRRKSLDGDAKDVETIITKEGVAFFNPHPSRVFWDNNHALASINSDTGCQYIGFWDICRFSDIDNNPDYFNKDKVTYGGAYFGDGALFSANQDYCNQYHYHLKPPPITTTNPALANDRKSNVGFYSGQYGDSSVLYVNFFKKLIPKDWGFGDYPWEVWVRLVVASDCTVIHGEWLPSTPGAYLGINESDSRQVNPSMATDIMPHQDIITNLLTMLLTLCEYEGSKIIGVDTAGLETNDADTIVNMLRDTPAGKKLVYKFDSSSENPNTGVGVKAHDVINISEIKVGASIDAIFQALIKEVTLCERMLILSQAEQGQAMPHEVSATESNAINTSSNVMEASISGQIRNARSAKKRIIYDSLTSCSEGDIVCPTKDRYTKETIIKAGFKPIDTEVEDFSSGIARRHTVTGAKQHLIHDYYFTSRDTPERRVNTQAANTLVQQLGLLMSVPAFTQSPGAKEKIYSILNEIFRLSGSGLDVVFELQEGESPDFGQNELKQMQEVVKQMQQMMQQLADATGQKFDELGKQNQQLEEQIKAQEAVNADQQKGINLVGQLSKEVEKLQAEILSMQDKNVEAKLRLAGSIYKDSYPTVQRSIEATAGLVPHLEGEKPVTIKANGDKPAVRK